MFRPTSPQRPLFGVEYRMSAEKRERLEKSWAHAFRTHALPLIKEDQFRKFFNEDEGRPNKSVRMILGVLVLKEVNDHTDGEALGELEWNAAWHYALDITPEEAHTCQKTLHNYRKLLLNDDQGASLFETTTAAIIEAAKLRTARQRHDSTHIVSNIKLVTRLGLFVSTITMFLEALRKEHPRLCERVPQELRERYLDREGYFSDARSSEAPRRIAQAALDVHVLVTLFDKHATVSRMPQYALLKRLYTDQCEPPDSETPIAIALREAPSGASLQSASDPDVTYGHKGKGYETQLSETCDEENPFQVVTAVSVNGANQSDQQQLIPVLDQVERTCGATPQVLHADAGFGSGENILAATERGTDLRAPIGANASVKHFPIDQFQFDVSDKNIVRCPAGQTPIGHHEAKNGLTILASFSLAGCATCPVRGICPAEPKSKARVLPFSAASLATARRRTEQDRPEFKEAHKIRSGIEATNSELKRDHGLRKLRVRTAPRVALAVRLKVLALNLKRYVQYLVSAPASAARPGETCAC
jgi:hypothetical protein